MLINKNLLDLSAAIRRGDRVEAEILMDKIFRLETIEDRESIQLGRFSRKAQNNDQR